MAMVLGTESANFSLVMRPQVGESTTSRPITKDTIATRHVQAKSTTSKPTTKDTTSTHLRVQAKSSTAITSTNMDAEFEKIISSVTSLDMVSRDLLDRLEIFRMERIEFTHLKVSLNEYQNGLNWLDEVYCEATHTIMEYNKKTGTVILNRPGASVFHSNCQLALNAWLQDIADSSPGRGFMSFVETKLFRFSKIPDVCLHHNDSDFPIIMVEVGFSESLTEMFDSARELFYISNGVTQVVVLVKIYEEGRGKLQGHPWGLTETEVQTKIAEGTLVKTILDWHEQNNINVVGNLQLHMYFWDAGRKHPPAKPIWEFEIGPSTLGSSEGICRRNMRNSLLDRDFRLNILGGSFPLPIERLRKAFEDSVHGEMRDRVSVYLKRHVYP
ncbi:hypothetical protein BJX96DRAFT_173828 [Aspergillus floccosus]